MAYCVIPAEFIKEKLTGGDTVDLLRYLYDNTGTFAQVTKA